MSNEKDIKITVAPGLCSMMFIAFLVLKLTKVIDWSWWWITAPLWIPLAAGFSIFFILLFLSIIFAGISSSSHRHRPF